jgi:hypothetical protein
MAEFGSDRSLQRTAFADHGARVEPRSQSLVFRGASTSASPPQHGEAATTTVCNWCHPIPSARSHGLNAHFIIRCGAVAATIFTLTACETQDPPTANIGDETTIAPTVPAATTTTSTVIDVSGLVETCVEFVPVAAFLADAEAIEILEQAGADPTAIERRCKEIVLNDPQRARAMGVQLRELQQATVTSTALPTTTTSTAPLAPAPPPAETALMPSVVCMDLQAAQNAIQRQGVFYSRSFDATGAGRRQIIDSNWLVVSQDPAPGTPIGEGDAILGVVKFGEGSC